MHAVVVNVTINDPLAHAGLPASPVTGVRRVTRLGRREQG
jgi:hypothetical protein